MATAKEFLDAGQLQAAIDEVTREVKANPADMAKRTFLFGLLAFAGEWERAEKQLDVIGHQDPQTEIGTRIYRQNIAAERHRAEVLAGKRFPKFLLDPPSYVTMQLKALGQIGASNFSEAHGLLDRVAEEGPALRGICDGQSFNNFRDADDLMNFVLEVYLQGEYFWLPFDQIYKIEIFPPAHLRDLIWAQARIDTKDDSQAFAGEVFIPALYVNSHKHENDQVRLGRMTDWQLLSEDLYMGVGQRLFLTGDKELAMLGVSTIEFESSASSII